MHIAIYLWACFYMIIMTFIYITEDYSTFKAPARSHQGYFRIIQIMQMPVDLSERVKLHQVISFALKKEEDAGRRSKDRWEMMYPVTEARSQRSQRSRQSFRITHSDISIKAKPRWRLPMTFQGDILTYNLTFDIWQTSGLYVCVRKKRTSHQEKTLHINVKVWTIPYYICIRKMHGSILDWESPVLGSIPRATVLCFLSLISKLLILSTKLYKLSLLKRSI